MYNYYNKVQLKEHMLYASEIAKLYGILTINDNPATSLVSRLLEDYIYKHNLQANQLYYNTSNGHMVKVYPEKIYSEVMYNLALNIVEKHKDSIDQHEILKININNKNYSFKIRRRQHEYQLEKTGI